MKAAICMVLVSVGLLGAMTLATAAAEAPGVSALSGPARTSLANPAVRFTVPRQPYVLLQRGALTAVVVDNRAVDERLRTTDSALPSHRRFRLKSFVLSP